MPYQAVGHNAAAVTAAGTHWRPSPPPIICIIAASCTRAAVAASVTAAAVSQHGELRLELLHELVALGVLGVRLQRLGHLQVVN